VNARQGLAAELQRIADQVLQDQPQLSGISVHRRQRVVTHLGPTIVDRQLEIPEHAHQQCLPVHGGERLRAPAHARVG